MNWRADVGMNAGGHVAGLWGSSLGMNAGWHVAGWWGSSLIHEIMSD